MVSAAEESQSTGAGESRPVADKGQPGGFDNAVTALLADRGIQEVVKDMAALKKTQSARKTNTPEKMTRALSDLVKEHDALNTEMNTALASATQALAQKNALPPEVLARVKQNDADFVTAFSHAVSAGVDREIAANPKVTPDDLDRVSKLDALAEYNKSHPGQEGDHRNLPKAEQPGGSKKPTANLI